MDNSLTEVLITDNRGMLIRNGKDGPSWDWCEAGWGGDWLHIKDAAGKKLFFRDLKTAYTAHGPCLSELEYRGHYGSASEVIIAPEFESWWIAYPDAEVQLPDGRENFGIASRALVIRSFRGNFSSKEYQNPTISLQVNKLQADGKLDIDARVVPPKDVVEFKPGDRFEMDLEWICVPRTAEDYYGPNEALRQHLAESPRSWKTIHREAVGNMFRCALTA